MFDRHEVQHVAITMADGSVAMMQFITRAESTKTGEVMERAATDESIQAEIDKTAFSQPVVSWRRVSPDDLPTTRKNRAAWRDDGKVIAIDPARIKPPDPDPRDVKIAALEAMTVLLRTRLDKLDGGAALTTRR